MGWFFLLLLIPVMVLFYVLAVVSRKWYLCPKCGEKLMVEHMRASHCNMCGAPLQEEKI